MTEIDEVRWAFEAKFDHEYPMERRGDHYRCWSTECIWRGYQAAYAAGRRKGLEEASAICDADGHEWNSDDVVMEKNYSHASRDAIRALIEKEAT